MKTLIVIFIFQSFLSCSFKPDEKAKSTLKQANPSLESTLDSDGDGTPDAQELQSGSDPFIADLPKIKGEFFNQLSIEIDLFNSTLNRFNQIKWSFADNKIHLPWSESSFDSPVGSIYMETLLKTQAFAASFKRIDFRFYDYNESIYSFSSPLLLEDALGDISEKMLQHKREGFDPYSAQAVILNRFEVTSSKYTSFRKPLFDLYYKSNKQEALIYLDSKELDGTYTFNEEHEIYVDFQSRNPEVIYGAFINSGGRFFIKLRDFTIYETGQKYSDLLKKVATKSIPVTASFMENEGKSAARIETIYVGVNGQTSKLAPILKKAFRDNILMTETSIDQIGGLFNRVRSHDEFGQNETLKWFVGAEYVNETIFEHDFRPNEGVGLAYFSDKMSQNTPIYATRAILKNDESGTSGKLPITTNTVKLRILPQKVLVPYPKIVSVTLPHCGKGAWEVDEVYYNKTTVGWADKTKDFSEHFLKEAFIKIHTIKETLLEGNLGILINRKFLKVNKVAPEVLELELGDPVTKSIANIDLQTTVDLFISPSPIIIQNGSLTQTGKKCEPLKAEPPRGGDSGRGGYEMGFQKTDPEGMGFSEERVLSKYDMNIHFFAY